MDVSIFNTSKEVSYKAYALHDDIKAKCTSD